MTEQPMLLELSSFVLVLIYLIVGESTSFVTFVYVFSFLTDCSHLDYFPCLYNILISAVLASDSSVSVDHFVVLLSLYACRGLGPSPSYCFCSAIDENLPGRHKERTWPTMK